MRSWNYLLFLLFCLIIASACKNRKLVKEEKGLASWEKSILEVKAERPLFKTLSFSGKGKTEIPSSDINLGFSYTINIQKDSLIWIRVTKFGLEAARALITKDSVFIMDRLNQTLKVADYAPAKALTGIELDFSTLQDLIIGNFNPIPKQLNWDGTSSSPLILNGIEAGTEFSYSVNPELKKLVEINAKNQLKNQASVIKYSDFMPQANTTIPKSGRIMVSAPRQAKIEFDHRKIDINPDRFSMKFRVPSSYKREVYKKL